MARNSKEQLECIDYLKIVDEFNAGAFNLCVSTLFPLFGCIVMKESDIRPIDLKENLLLLQNGLLEEQEDNYYDYFSGAIKVSILN